MHTTRFEKPSGPIAVVQSLTQERTKLREEARADREGAMKQSLGFCLQLKKADDKLKKKDEKLKMAADERDSIKEKIRHLEQKVAGYKHTPAEVKRVSKQSRSSELSSTYDLQIYAILHTDL